MLTAFIRADALVYLGNDMHTLDTLEERYAQKLLITKSKIYLIPKACRLERYFGGSSQGDLKRVNVPLQTKAIEPTQAVFEAKQTKNIEKDLALKKEIALLEGKEAQEFLADSEGRAFGGESEGDLNFKTQKSSAKQATSNKQPETLHPSCKLLEDGSGYSLKDITQAKFYSQGKFIPITKNTILFQ